MDAILPPLCLLLGIALPVTLLFLLARRMLRQLAVASAYREVSRHLQLTADTRGVSVQGHLDARRLWIGEVMTGYGADRATEVRGVLDLARPLGLGLYIHQRGRRGGWFRRSRSPEQQSGDADFDKHLHIHADQADQVRLLLTPSVKQCFRKLSRRWPDVELTDIDIRVTLRAPEATTARLLALVDAMVDLATAVEEARRHLPAPDGVQEWVEPWQQLAERLDLDFEPWLPAMSGSWDGRRVVIAARRTTDGFVADLRTWFHHHAELGLRLRPQVEPDGYWSTGQDIQVGHPRFDAAFVIKGYDPAAVRLLLDDTARAHLLELTALGTLEVDDRRLVLRGTSMDPALIEPALHEAVDAARSLGW